MTIQLCLSICREKGYAYAGLEYSEECFCGDQPKNGFDWMWQTKCDLRCSGDRNQICGGKNAMSVWTVPPKILNGLCVHDFPYRILSGQSRTFNNSGSELLTTKWCKQFCQGKIITIYDVGPCRRLNKPWHISHSIYCRQNFKF